MPASPNGNGSTVVRGLNTGEKPLLLELVIARPLLRDGQQHGTGGLSIGEPRRRLDQPLNGRLT